MKFNIVKNNLQQHIEHKNAARSFSALLVVALLLSAFCGAFPTVTFASAEVSAPVRSDLIDDLTQKVEDLQKEIDRVKNEIAGLKDTNDQIVSSLANKKAEETTLNAALALYTTQMAKAEDNIEQTKENIVYCEETIVDIKQELVDLKVQNEELYENYKLTLRALRERQDMTLLEMLFNANSISEFLSYIERAKDLAEYKRKTMSKMEESFKELTNRQEEAEKELVNHEELLVQFTEMRDAYQVQIEETESILTVLADEIIKTEGIIVDLEESTKEAQEGLADLIAQQEDAVNKLLEEEERLELARQTLLWPVDIENHRVTSKYGYRYHPITGVYKFHTGIDIVGPVSGDIQFDNIYASMGGVVITAVVSRKSTGYGTYVIISHGYNENYGGNISTLYAHCEEIYVKEGDVVKQGDLIGLVGTTGASTGYHLHYEVRKNNNTTDPLLVKYITELNGTPRNPTSFITKAW